MSFSKENQIFLEIVDQEIQAFMICQLPDTMEVPHCTHVQKVHVFRVETWFKRSLLESFDVIKRRAKDFVGCMIVQD